MNWDAIGAIGEIIGAIAVVVSLAYLAIQSRYNTKQVEEQNRTHEITVLAEMASIWQSGRNDLDSLTNEERFRFTNLAEEFSRLVTEIYKKSGNYRAAGT